MNPLATTPLDRTSRAIAVLWVLAGLGAFATILLLGTAIMLAALIIAATLAVRPTNRIALRASVGLASVMALGYFALAVGQIVDRGPFFITTAAMTVVSAGLAFVSFRLLRDVEAQR